MTGESHEPGRMTFAVTLKAAAQFTKGEIIQTADVHGDPIDGRVVAIKEGSGIALVIVETKPCQTPTGMTTSTMAGVDPVMTK